MALRIRHRRSGLFNTLVICVTLTAALWLLSVWSTTRFGCVFVHTSLHRGMVRASVGDSVEYLQQFHSDSSLDFHCAPFEWPASFGLHWPYWDGTIACFEIGVPLVAIWAPGAVVIGVLARRKTRPGHCPKCDYDLTGNASGICPECGTRIGRGNFAPLPGSEATTSD